MHVTSASSILDKDLTLLDFYRHLPLRLLITTCPYRKPYHYSETSPLIICPVATRKLYHHVTMSSNQETTQYLASLVARVKARAEANEERQKGQALEAKASRTTISNTPQDQSLQQVGTRAAQDPASMLQYLPVTWTEQDSLADTDSTMTSGRARDLNTTTSKPPDARNDNSVGRLRSLLRADYNNAVQRLDSDVSSRSGSAFFYLESGQLDRNRTRPIQHDRGYPYCCPNPREIEHGKRNVFLPENAQSDWRVQALERNQAGHRSMQDFSEQHLADRLFYNAHIRSPTEHLEGSQKAALQDLRALYMENNLLRHSTAQAMANSEHAQVRAQTLYGKIEKIEQEIEAMRAMFDAKPRGIN
jgi:hypothetical protein